MTTTLLTIDVLAREFHARFLTQLESSGLTIAKRDPDSVSVSTLTVKDGDLLGYGFDVPCTTRLLVDSLDSPRWADFWHAANDGFVAMVEEMKNEGGLAGKELFFVELPPLPAISARVMKDNRLAFCSRTIRAYALSHDLFYVRFEVAVCSIEPSHIDSK